MLFSIFFFCSSTDTTRGTLRTDRAEDDREEELLQKLHLVEENRENEMLDKMRGVVDEICAKHFTRGSARQTNENGSVANNHDSR